jgi:hypothetical protein
MTSNDLPPTQYLVMEVLAARYRTGEVLWTFPSNLRPAMVLLARLGLIGWKSGVEALTIRAWLTDHGREHSLKDDFATPVQRALDQAAAEMRANYVTGERSIEFINGFEEAAALADSFTREPPAHLAAESTEEA